MRGKYRWRTWLRRRSPWWLINLGFAPPGKKDCGDHEWHCVVHIAPGLDQVACYHCVAEDLRGDERWKLD